MKKVSVVILNWNGEKLLSQFLPSVVEFTESEKAEIIVVDNCSTDDSVNYVLNYFPSVKVVQFSENYGYAKGYNEALKNIHTEYSVLLNSDVEVTDGWLQRILDVLDNEPQIVAVQPQILAYNNKDFYEYAGAAGGFIDKYGYPFCRGRIFDKVEKVSRQYNNQIDIFWASGACLAIRTDEFKNNGGFDSSFFAHMEEIDLCWRLNSRGKRIVCVPASTVYHVGAATLSSESPRKTYLNFRNNLLMLYKNLPDKDLKRILRIRKFLDYLAAFQMLISGKTENASAVIKAHKEFRIIKSDYSLSRKENMNKAVSKSIETMYIKSILWSYYIKGIKQFSKLSFKTKN